MTRSLFMVILKIGFVIIIVIIIYGIPTINITRNEMQIILKEHDATDL